MEGYCGVLPNVGMRGSGSGGALRDRAVILAVLLFPCSLTYGLIRLL